MARTGDKGLSTSCDVWREIGSGAPVPTLPGASAGRIFLVNMFMELAEVYMVEGGEGSVPEALWVF